MADYTGSVKILPTPQALSDFGLSRYVGNTDKNNNPFIKYATEKQTSNAEEVDRYLNEVFIDVFEYQPVKITTDTDSNGGVRRAKMDFGNGGAPKIFNRYRILIPTQEVSISHSHTWNKGSSFMGDIYNGINSVADVGAVVLATASNAQSRLTGGTSFESTIANKTDYQKTYEKSAYPALQLDFNLFTNDQFVRDIYKPIMDLTSYTYPKRVSPDDSSKSSNEDTLLKTGSEYAQTAVQEAKEFISLTARQYTFRPPCLFNLYHQAGLYTYSNCFCSNMNVTYGGPWYNASAEETANFNMLNPPNINVNVRTLPSTARVSMKFESTELMFRDDFKLISQRFQSILRSGATTTSFDQFLK